MFGGLLFGIARTRGVDGDEPYYAAAIDSVARGKRLYVDFFHPQAPVQPLLYSLFYRLGVHRLQGLRGVSVACCVVTGLVWWRFLTRLVPRSTAALLCLLAVTLSDGAFFTWGASLKTYPLTTVLTAIGAYAWWEGFRHTETSRARPWFALSGVAWALAAGARLSFAAPAAFLCLVLLARATRASYRGRRWATTDLVAWGVGAGAGALVTGFQALRDPKGFWFDTVTAQRLREVAPAGRERFEYLFYSVHDSLAQYPWLTFIVAAGTASALALAFSPPRGGWLRADRSLCVMPVAGALYVVAMFAVHPQYPQYYEGSLGAFFVPCVLTYVARHAQAIPAGAFVPLGALVLASSAQPLPAAAGDVGRLDGLASLGALIEKNTKPGDQVWGYHAFWAFQSRRKYVNGMECQFGYAVAQKLTAAERRRRHLLSVGEVADVLARRIPKVAVTDAGTWVLSYSPADANRVDEELKRNYRVILDQSPVKIWLRNDAVPAP